MKFFEELKRRNVIKATMAYVVVAWVLIQVFTNILPVFQAPPWVLKVLMILLAIGLPVWIVFSWVYDVTPDGLKKTESIPSDPTVTATTNKRLNILILVVLIIAVGLHFLDRTEKNEKMDGAKVAGLSEDEPRQNSIAVLPFLDMSPNKDQAYYSDGVAVEINNVLCKFKSLQVVGTTSSFAFKNKGEDIKSIGKKLNVNHLLEGSVQKQNDLIRITIRLTDAGSGYSIFSETYTDRLENIFELQSMIAKDIAQKIVTNLDPNTSLHKRKKVDPKAYETFLKGRLQFVNGPLNMEPGQVYKAKKFFEKALESDPDFAEANAYLSLVHFNLADWALNGNDKTRVKNSLDSARILAKRAHDLDSLSPGAHMAMGSYYFHDYDWINAEKEKRRAVALNPGGADEKFSLSSFLSQFGFEEEALKLSQEALELSPLDPEAELNHVKTLYFARKYEEGKERCERLIRENPKDSGPYQFLFVCLADLGQFEEANMAFGEFLKLSKQSKGAEIFMENDFRTALKKSLELNDEYQFRYLSKNIYKASFNAFLGNMDTTFKYLNEVVKEKDPEISWLGMARFDFIRNDPRFQEIYEKAGLKAYYDHKKGL